jgi:ketosteroid isomerase-like protein
MNPDNALQQQQILDLGRRWAEAELAADVATLDTLLDDDFVAVGPLGFVLDKRQWLGPRQAGDLKTTSFQWLDPAVRFFGDTAVVIGTQVQQATYQGQDASGRFRVTQIAAHTGGHGRWVLVGMHLSPIAQPPTR